MNRKLYPSDHRKRYGECNHCRKTYRRSYEHRGSCSWQCAILSRVSIDEKSGCWNWTGPLQKNGYGTTSINNKTRLAHRVSYECFREPIAEIPGYHGAVLMHRCDNRKCVNPDHLQIGTIQDNAADMVEKNRSLDQRGEKNHNIKWSDGLVRSIRADSRSSYKLSEETGIPASTIRAIRNNSRRLESKCRS